MTLAIYVISARDDPGVTHTPWPRRRHLTSCEGGTRVVAAGMRIKTHTLSMMWMTMDDSAGTALNKGHLQQQVNRTRDLCLFRN